MAQLPISYSASITLNVNGTDHQIEVDHRWTLLRVLRDVLGLTGAKRGCDRGECGACTVLVDGDPVCACSMLALQVGGRQVRTVEGLGDANSLNVLQEAFLAEDGGQCGFCTPGMVMSSYALLQKHNNPSMDQIRHGVSGNICRCGTYQRVRRAIHRASTMANQQDL